MLYFLTVGLRSQFTQPLLNIVAPVCSGKWVLALTKQDRCLTFRSQLRSQFSSCRCIIPCLVRLWVMTWLARLARHTIFSPRVLVFSRRPGRYKKVATILWIWTCIFWAIVAWLMLRTSFGVLNVFSIMSRICLGWSFQFWMQPSLWFMSHMSQVWLLQLLKVEAIIMTASDRWIDVKHFG